MKKPIVITILIALLIFLLVWPSWLPAIVLQFAGYVALIILGLVALTTFLGIGYANYMRS